MRVYDSIVKGFNEAIEYESGNGKARVRLVQTNNIERSAKKKAALAVLEGLELDLPDNFDDDKELADALEEKYGTAD